MNETIAFSLIMVLSVFVSSCSQILLKTAADKPHKNKLAEYLNARVCVAYVLFALSAGASMLVLRYIPLTRASILESSGYVFVVILSSVFLHEKLHKKQLAGISLIIIGLFIFSMN